MIQLRPCELYHSAGPSDELGNAPACMHPEVCLKLTTERLDSKISSGIANNERKLYLEMNRCASRLREELIRVLARSRGRDDLNEKNESSLAPDGGINPDQYEGKPAPKDEAQQF